jgi:hypothetical protein
MNNHIVHHPGILIYPQYHRENDRLHRHGYYTHLPEDMRSWLKANCEHRWHVDVCKKALIFESSEEAMRFKLQWL